MFHLIARLLNGSYDFWIRAAAAQIPAHIFLNVRVGLGMALFHARHSRHDLSRRAVAALKPVLIDESFLHGMQRPIYAGEAFDRFNMLALHGHCEGEAGQHAPPIDVDGASTALTLIASFLRAGQMQMFSQRVQHRDARIQGEIVTLAVDIEFDAGCAARGGSRAGLVRKQRFDSDGSQCRAARDYRSSRDTGGHALILSGSDIGALGY